MYNRYLSQIPVDVHPEPVPEPEPAPAPSPPAAGLLSALSGLFGQKNGLGDLFSSENLIVLAALLFLTSGEEEPDTELIGLAVLFLLIGL